ncbi:hypothetical protein BLA29_008210, partial [Euroglyphus maynei]
DEKPLSDRLKLPLQRLNDYQLLLKAKDFFDVIDTDGTVRERFIFFFKSRMFITEINKNLSADQRTYNVEKIIKLPEVEISDEDANTLIIKSKDTTDTNFPIRLRCQDQERIKSWLKMINSLPSKCFSSALPFVKTKKNVSMIN